MKRMIWILTALLLMATGGMAQTVNGLFNHYEDKPGAEYKNLTPLLMGIIKTFAADKSEEGRVIKSIKSIKVLNLEECAPEVRQKFAQKTRNLKPRRMELQAFRNDPESGITYEGSRTHKVYIRRK